MAVPKRRSEMIKKMMHNIKSMKKELSKEEKERMEKIRKPVSEEEHKKRMDMLKQTGILK